MSWTNELATLKSLIDGLSKRIFTLENSRKVTFTPVTTDPTTLRPGDAWLNTTTNVLKAVDKNGSVRVITWT